MYKCKDGKIEKLSREEEELKSLEMAKWENGAATRQWLMVRIERDKRLAECDWTQLADAPVDKTAWAEYRQSLRDITTQSDPFNINWPNKPE